MSLPNVTILPAFYQALLAHGFSQAEAVAVLGGNALRFLAAALPD
jgi:microsomal dipeptidase-like Zn-dependent dipeptidase